MPKHVAATPPDTEWRRLSEFLWVGADPHGPVGIVERGWRFKALDVDGILVARCRSLEEAQSLLEHLVSSRRLTELSVGPAA